MINLWQIHNFWFRLSIYDGRANIHLPDGRMIMTIACRRCRHARHLTVESG